MNTAIVGKMLEYPKINTLFERNKDTFVVDPSRFKMDAYEQIGLWDVDEKIHGQNIRIQWDGQERKIAGRTTENVGDIHKDLIAEIKAIFPEEKLAQVFSRTTPEKPVTLFGEGYGAGINKGGGYSEAKRFVLFDVHIDGWWLQRDAVAGIAGALEIQLINCLGRMTTKEIVEMVKVPQASALAALISGNTQHPMEGVIMRTDLFDRFGQRVICKLKHVDFVK